MTSGFALHRRSCSALLRNSLVGRQRPVAPSRSLLMQAASLPHSWRSGRTGLSGYFSAQSLATLTPTCRRQNETTTRKERRAGYRKDGTAQSLTRLGCGSVRYWLQRSVYDVATISKSLRCLPSIRPLEGVGLIRAPYSSPALLALTNPSLICENDRPFVRAESVVRTLSSGLRGTLEKHSASVSPLEAPAARRCNPLRCDLSPLP